MLTILLLKDVNPSLSHDYIRREDGLYHVISGLDSATFSRIVTETNFVPDASENQVTLKAGLFTRADGMALHGIFPGIKARRIPAATIPEMAAPAEVALTSHDSAAVEEAILQALITDFGWENQSKSDRPLFWVTKDIGGGNAGGIINPKGIRRVIARVSEEGLSATHGDEPIARAPLSNDKTPAQNAAALDAAVNLIDPNYSQATKKTAEVIEPSWKDKALAENNALIKEAEAKNLSPLTPKDFMAEIASHKQQGFPLADLMDSYNEAQQDLIAVRAGTIVPSKIVGTGYKNPKKVAIAWLEERIATLRESIKSGGILDAVNLGNYNNYLRELNKPVTQQAVATEKEARAAIDDSYRVKFIASDGEAYSDYAVNLGNTAETIRVRKFADGELRFLGSEPGDQKDNIIASLERHSKDKALKDITWHNEKGVVVPDELYKEAGIAIPARVVDSTNDNHSDTAAEDLHIAVREALSSKGWAGFDTGAAMTKGHFRATDSGDYAGFTIDRLDTYSGTWISIGVALNNPKQSAEEIAESIRELAVSSQAQALNDGTKPQRAAEQKPTALPPVKYSVRAEFSPEEARPTLGDEQVCYVRWTSFSKPVEGAFVAANDYDKKEFGLGVFRGGKDEFQQEVIARIDPKGMKLFFVSETHYRETGEIKWLEPIKLTRLVISNKALFEKSFAPLDASTQRPAPTLLEAVGQIVDAVGGLIRDNGNQYALSVPQSDNSERQLSVQPINGSELWIGSKVIHDKDGRFDYVDQKYFQLTEVDQAIHYTKSLMAWANAQAAEQQTTVLLSAADEEDEGPRL